MHQVVYRIPDWMKRAFDEAPLEEWARNSRNHIATYSDWNSMEDLKPHWQEIVSEIDLANGDFTKMVALQHKYNCAMTTLNMIHMKVKHDEAFQGEIT